MKRVRRRTVERKAGKLGYRLVKEQTLDFLFGRHGRWSLYDDDRYLTAYATLAEADEDLTGWIDVSDVLEKLQA